MTSGDETRWDDRPSLFDDNPAEETQAVQNPFPSRQPPQHPSAQPQGRPGRPAPALPPAGYGAQPAGGPTPGFGPAQAGGPPGREGGLGPGLGSGSSEADFFGPGPGQGLGGGQAGGRPTILANQASDWDGNFRDGSVSRGARTGMIGLFLLGLVAVVVIALGLAAWSVLRGGDENTGEATAAGTETSVPGRETTGEATPPPAVTEDTTPAFDPNALQVSLSEDPFLCDGGTREFALITGADPNEAVSFSSPQAEGLRAGQADLNGELPIRWQCDPGQAGTSWELTATGDVSGRTVTFLFAGVVAPSSSTVVSTPTELAVQVIEDPFLCDGGTREFALITGADPNETITFTSPQSPGLRSGQAGVNGETPIRWQCDPDQKGMAWDLTATGEVSGRTVTFSFTGG